MCFFLRFVAKFLNGIAELILLCSIIGLVLAMFAILAKHPLLVYVTAYSFIGALASIGWIARELKSRIYR